MGDKHVCSFCGTSQEGKAHIKIVFENWPVAEEVTYRRKGQVKKQVRQVTQVKQVTKEVITALGLECIRDPARWGAFPIEPEQVPDFFDRVRRIGKNPTFLAMVEGGRLRCLALGCAQRSPADAEWCVHILTEGYAGTGLEAARCWVGHPGITLLRRPAPQSPREPPFSWRRLFGNLSLNGSNVSIPARVYLTCVYTIPLLWYCLVVLTPLWLGQRIGNAIRYRG